MKIRLTRAYISPTSDLKIGQKYPGYGGQVDFIRYSIMQSKALETSIVKFLQLVTEGEMVEAAITNSSGNGAPSTDQDRKSYNEPPMITMLNPHHKEYEEKEDDDREVATVTFIDFFDNGLTVNDRVCAYASSSEASSVDVKDVSLELTLG
ncbi:hypothetical protein L1987_58501 [Smallanthus sonchifolius]|uniref:Uncharacterized protein n=1 Tax=Smallanthus sonchifolius TaxID=185202 RepID=A0ACB9DG35_9ASTR|nr:hypothetical protein L1987_58501 [Smallanthus sonchifolius]